MRSPKRDSARRIADSRSVPEGDTVHLTAARLGRALQGAVLTQTDFRVPRYATVDLSGAAVLAVVARGKHLLFRIDGGTTLHTHFKMQGEWHLYRPGDRWREPRDEARLVLSTKTWDAVGFRLPVIELLRTDSEESVVGHLGPDVLGPDWDPVEVVHRLERSPQRTVAEALLDQSVLAGVGNIYKSEICFLQGLFPWISIGQITDLARLVALTKRLMEANRHTGRQITTGDGRRGRDHWVYGRGGQPCRRCGTPISRRVEPAAERVTYWCSRCQPEYA